MGPARKKHAIDPCVMSAHLSAFDSLARAALDTLARRVGLRVDPTHYVTHAPRDAHVTLTYLGTAGFIVEHAGRVVVLDPFVTRPSLARTLGYPLRPDVARVARYIPRADDVLVGHAHYDHILDAPAVCHATGARLIGSSATCMVGRAAGLPESRMLQTSGREAIACGPITVRGLPSIHARAVGGRVPLPGDIVAPPPWPARFHELRHGLVLDWFLDTGSLRIVHIDSADFLPAELEGVRADVVCLCAVGRQHRPGYTREIVETLQARWVIPCHWDTMITPIEDEPYLLPGVDLPGFLDEIRDAGATPLLTPLLGKQSFEAMR
jgi:L-ascorbate metabolism protein UlaG (beta-lactamase superfamily)